VGVIAVLMRDLVARGALSKECGGNQAVHGALLLKAVAAEAYIKAPVLNLYGLEDFAGLSVADLPKI